jgi:hypothetical protein
VSQSSDLDALNNALVALTNLHVAINLVSEQLASLKRQTVNYDLQFDSQGELTAVFYRVATHKDELRRVDEQYCLEIRSNCKWLPEYVKSLWKYQPEVDAALAALPSRLLEKLDALTGVPWLATARRNCIDKILAWPGEKHHQTSLVAIKVNGGINELLQKAAKKDPFSTWKTYEESLLGYKHDLIAIRDEVQPKANLEVNEISGNPPQKRRKPDRSTEARDKWIYDECCNVTPYDTIVIRLRKKPKTWPRIDTKQGIRQAGQRYAERHNLPPIPPRQE